MSRNRISYNRRLPVGQDWLSQQHLGRAAARNKSLLAAICLLLFAAGDVHAGIGDTVLPQFSDGKPSVLVLSVPGVVKRNSLQTAFLCTSVDSQAVDIGVEVFAPDGSLLNSVASDVGVELGVAPGQTVTFATSATATYLESVIIPLLTNISQGSARVVASSSQVRCNVMLLDKLLTPPVALATLGEGIKPTPEALPPSIPLPHFSDSQAATHAALFPGVVKRFDAETAFFCTSTAAANIDVGVEVLDSAGTVANDVATGNGAVLNVAPGETVTFATTGTASLLETSVIAIPTVAQGLARVVSNSGDLTCSAIVLDAGLAPPTAMSGLAGREATAGSSGLTLASPLPAFSDGKPSVHISTIPGVLKRGQLQTVFFCASLDVNPLDIGVQIFGLDGTLLNDVTAGVGAILNVAPGQTVTIATSATATFLESAVIPLVTGLQGLARIVASSGQVRCNAMVVDDLVTPPVTLTALGDPVQPAVGAQPPTVSLPVFSDGHQATHAAYFPGLVKRFDAETDIFCTSVAAGNIDIGVEVFRPDGSVANDVGLGNGALLGVAPGATVTFGTTGTAALFETTVIVLPGIAQGMARVVSDSDQLLCSGVVLDAGLSPPTAMSALVGYGANGNAVCGDGVVQAGEQCDGASDAACPGQCRSSCLCPQVCGDGFVQPAEQCDDGNTVGGDCCSPTCQFETLGLACLDDGNLCNGPETCNGAGSCISGPALDCDDGNACTQDSCEPASGSCVSEEKPAVTCVTAARASIQIKNQSKPATNKLKWKWQRGGAIAQADLGDPSSSATYTLCVYDKSAATPSLATALTIAPNAIWDNRDPKGWQYKDKLGTFDGVKKVQLRTGRAGRSKAQLQAKGLNLPVPLPFSGTAFFAEDPDVTVQLFNSDTSTCWTSAFSTAKKNTAKQFKAKSP